MCARSANLCVPVVIQDTRLPVEIQPEPQQALFMQPELPATPVPPPPDFSEPAPQLSNDSVQYQVASLVSAFL